MNVTQAGPPKSGVFTESRRVKHLLIGVTAAITIAAMGPASAQAPRPATAQLPAPPITYPDYRAVAPTPEDAYRQGLINRWQLEQLAGPTPQAMQGPSPDGNKGGEVAR